MNTSRRSVGLLSALLFIIIFLGLYKTTAPAAQTKPQTPPNKLDVDPPGQALGPGGPPPAAEQSPLGASATSGHVLPHDLVLHDPPATYPRLTRLSDGSILLGFMRLAPAPTPTTRVLTVARSVDGGRTFAPWGEVVRCDRSDCDNIFLLEVPGGPGPDPRPRVLAAFRNHDVPDPGGARNPPYLFRITVCESLDGGRTWRYLSTAAEKAAPWGLWEPFMRIGAGGEVQMTYSRELEARDQDTMMRVSYDRGKTWSEPRTVTGAGELLRDGMTGIAATADRGRPALVMVFETPRHGTFSLEAVVSYDDGDTWGHRQVVFETQRGANAGAPQIEAFANGGLATVFMTDMDEDVRDWPRKASVKTVLGGPLVDGKIHWQSPQPACPPQSFWPGILKLSDTRLLVACEHKGLRGRLLEWI